MHGGKLRLIHANPIVLHLKDKPIPILIAAEHNASAAALIFDAVVEGIFHQRLQQHFQHNPVPDGRLDLDRIVENVLVPDLLNL